MSLLGHFFGEKLLERINFFVSTAGLYLKMDEGAECLFDQGPDNVAI